MEIKEYPNKTLLEEIKDLIEDSTDDKNWKVYIHESPSSKKYVGITYRSYTERFANGLGYSKCPRFYNAIKKYGWNNIRHFYLLENLSEKSAKAIETKLIQKFKEGGKCYNIAKGGEGGVMPEETRNKLREKLLGRFVSYDTKQKISNNNLSRDIIWHQKISDAHKKAVLQYDYNGLVLIKEWDSALSVKNELGIDNSAIALCCNNKRSHAGNYKWKWLENKDIPFYDFEKEKEIFRRKLSMRGGSILQYDKFGNLIKEWECLYDVLKGNPTYKRAGLQKNINGKCLSKYGYIWKKKSM